MYGDNYIKLYVIWICKVGFDLVYICWIYNVFYILMLYCYMFFEILIFKFFLMVLNFSLKFVCNFIFDYILILLMFIEGLIFILGIINMII